MATSANADAAPAFDSQAYEHSRDTVFADTLAHLDDALFFNQRGHALLALAHQAIEDGKLAEADALLDQVAALCDRSEAGLDKADASL